MEYKVFILLKNLIFFYQTLVEKQTGEKATLFPY
jgi:hypothetical protein